MAEKDVLTGETLKQLIQLVQNIYKSDGRPWVIGFSGGKDSTAVLQLVWAALKRLPEKERTKKIFVISSDTLVEAPAVVNRIAQEQNNINKAAIEQKLPIEAHMVTPEIKDTFWVNIIGKGYPTPYTNFRWCTDRLKIQPTTKFITETVAKYGEVIILLGARRQESSSRAQVMSNRDDLGNRLSRHNDMPNAFVFTPIEDWSTNDVWTFIMQMKNPWGGNNKELKTMYLNAQGGECPLVIDTSTSSCGGGRFGCWTCTVVNKDKSMDNLIDNGHDWMKPMQDFRSSLTDIGTFLSEQDVFKNKLNSLKQKAHEFFLNPEETDEKKRKLKPEVIKLLKVDDDFDIKQLSNEKKEQVVQLISQFDTRSIYRDLKRRNGRIQFFTVKSGENTIVKITWGPFKLEAKKAILKGLLEKQKEILENVKIRDDIVDKNINLISQKELHQIRKMWRFEEGDWEDSLPQIYKEATGLDFEGLNDDNSDLGGSELALLAEICTKHGLSERMVMELFEVERSHQQMGRRSGIYNKLGSVLKKDWRTFEFTPEENN